MGPKITQDWLKIPFFPYFSELFIYNYLFKFLQTVQTFLMGHGFHGYMDGYGLERHGAAI